MRLIDQSAGAVLLALALFFGYQAANLSYYSSIGPGPGFFPVWLCALLAVLALATILDAARAPQRPVPADFVPPRTGLRRILAAVAGLLAFAVLIGTLGFVVTAFLFYVALLPILGRRSPIEIIVLALLGSVGVFQLFSRVLSQPLPSGTLGWLPL